MHRAGTTQRHAATELGACQVRIVPQRPEQRHVLIDVESACPSIDFQLDHRIASLPIRTVRLILFIGRRACLARTTLALYVSIRSGTSGAWPNRAPGNPLSMKTTPLA